MQVDNSLHHHHLKLCPAWRDSQLVRRCWYDGNLQWQTGRIAKLHHFQPVYVVLGVRIHTVQAYSKMGEQEPRSTMLSSLLARPNVQQQKCTDRAGFLWCCLYVICPIQVALEVKTKKFEADPRKWFVMALIHGTSQNFILFAFGQQLLFDRFADMPNIKLMFNIRVLFSRYFSYRNVSVSCDCANIDTSSSALAWPVWNLPCPLPQSL